MPSDLTDFAPSILLFPDLVDFFALLLFLDAFLPLFFDFLLFDFERELFDLLDLDALLDFVFLPLDYDRLLFFLSLEADGLFFFDSDFWLFFSPRCYFFDLPLSVTLPFLADLSLFIKVFFVLVSLSEGLSDS